MSASRRIIVGITGASGVIYGIRLLEALRPTPLETHLIMSRAAVMTLAYETDLKLPDVRALADACHSVHDVAANPSSGSYRTAGMVIAPCSMRTLAEIATGVTSNLLSRSADVILKERRRLVLLVRETPLHTVHLRNLLTAAELGAVIAPPVPAFYNRPQSVDDLVNHTVGRVLDLFDIDTGQVRRWGETPALEEDQLDTSDPSRKSRINS
ncbi:MAG: UbiX family flavin prenyltransferase [Gammaproteobacteria bacterium]|nr:UbiX family flavin prenyltransferase [Gammaproteobacteria bacterium]